MRPVAYAAVMPTSKSNLSDITKSNSSNSLHSNDSCTSVEEKKTVPAITKTDTSISGKFRQVYAGMYPIFCTCNNKVTVVDFSSSQKILRIFYF